jgi:glycosidase
MRWLLVFSLSSVVGCEDQPAVGFDAGFTVMDAGRSGGADSGRRRDAGVVPDGGEPRVCSVDFILDRRGAEPRSERVYIAGSFNDWSPDRDQLEVFETGVFAARIALPRGALRYKFVVDGAWIVDPHNPTLSEDEEGNLNSYFVNDCSTRSDAVARLAHSFDPRDGALLQQSYLVPPGLTAVSLNGEALPPDAWSLEGGRRLSLPFVGGLVQIQTLGLHWADGATRQFAVGPEAIGAGDWRRGPLYFAMIDRFKNGRDDNDRAFATGPPATDYQGGDIAGLRAQLVAGYFDPLGVKALWLSWPMAGPERLMAGHRLDLDPRSRGCQLNPFDDALPRQPVGYSGFHGYWPVDLQRVDDRFGDTNELVDLVRTAHQRGVAVIFDLPANHLHEDHPIAQDPARASWFNHPARVCGADVPWDEAPETCWFTRYLPDLNLGNDAPRRWLVAQALAVAERFGADGFRIDAVKHLDRRFLRDLRHALKARLELGGQVFWTIGETFSGDAPSVASFVADDGVHVQFDFPTNYQILQAFAQGHGSLGAMDEAVRAIKAQYPAELMVNFVGNHDIARFTSLASAQLCGAWDMASNQALGWVQPPVAPAERLPYARLLQALTYAYTVPGMPMIYYGDEFGMPGGGDPDNRRAMRFAPNRSANEDWLFEKVTALADVRARVDGLRGADWPLPAFADAQTLAFVRRGATADALVIINRGPARRLRLALIEENLHGDLNEAFSGATAVMNPQSGHEFLLAEESVAIWYRR